MTAAASDLRRAAPKGLRRRSRGTGKPSLSNGSARWATRSQYADALSIDAPIPAPDDEEEDLPLLLDPEFDVPWFWP